MNKSDLVDVVAQSAALTRKQAEMAINSTFAAIADAMANEEKVVLLGFGTFETRIRSARKGRNPSTNQAMDIPESKSPSFKASKSLKDKVNA